MPAERDDVPPLVNRFCQWMRSHRGSRESTLSNYRFVLRKLLQRFGCEPRLYTAAQLRAFILAESSGCSHSKAETHVTAVRMFVRFLIVHGECPDSLQHAIPRLGKWGQAALPRYIDSEAVERVIAACEANTPLGSRDRAVLLLLARLGLRAGDVAQLRLDDLDWRQGRIRVSGKSRTPAWLPLPQDAGDAVLHYLATRPRAQVVVTAALASDPSTRANRQSVPHHARPIHPNPLQADHVDRTASNRARGHCHAVFRGTPPPPLRSDSVATPGTVAAVDRSGSAPQRSRHHGDLCKGRCGIAAANCGTVARGEQRMLTRDLDRYLELRRT